MPSVLACFSLPILPTQTEKEKKTEKKKYAPEAIPKLS